MTNLLSAWISLFNEDNFVGLENYPEQLRNLSMLFMTLQKEFRGVEETFEKKLNNLKFPYNTQKGATKEKKPQKQSSPTLNKHRKIQSKNTKKLTSIENTPKTCLDIIDTSIIEGTPEMNKTKRRIKKSENTSLFPTLPLTSSKLVVTRSDETTESSEIDIDRILEKLDTTDKTSENRDVIGSESLNWDYHVKSIKENTPTRQPLKMETSLDANLKVWSCKDCENFYKGLKLSAKELQEKMTTCARHVCKMSINDSTWNGYWDMTIPQTNGTKKDDGEDFSRKEDPEESFRFF